MVRKIQADRFGGASALHFVQGGLPEPAAGQVRLRVYAAGVNPADTYILGGSYAFYKPSLPYTPGFDGAGTVDALGAGVTDLKIGDRVFAAPLGLRHSGSYAEFMTCDAAGVHPLPAHLSFGQGAVVGSRSPISFTPRLTMVAEADIRGTALWNMSDVDVSQATNAVAEYLARGSAAPVVARSFPLERAADAMEAVMSSRARGKLVLDCSR